MKKAYAMILAVALVLMVVSCATTAAPAKPAAAAAPVAAPAAAPAASSGGNGVMIWIEAEDGVENKGLWTIKESDKASGGKCIVTTAAKTKPLPTVNGSIKYNFNLEKAGKYKIFMRYRATSDGNGSIYYEVNGEVVHSSYDNNSNFEWNFFNKDNPGTAVVFDFPAGANSFIIHHREPKTEIDKLLITDNMALTLKDLEKM